MNLFEINGTDFKAYVLKDAQFNPPENEVTARAEGVETSGSKVLRKRRKNASHTIPMLIKGASKADLASKLQTILTAVNTDRALVRVQYHADSDIFKTYLNHAQEASIVDVIYFTADSLWFDLTLETDPFWTKDETEVASSIQSGALPAAVTVSGAGGDTKAQTRIHVRGVTNTKKLMIGAIAGDGDLTHIYEAESYAGADATLDADATARGSGNNVVKRATMSASTLYTFFTLSGTATKTNIPISNQGFETAGSGDYVADKWLKTLLGGTAAATRESGGAQAGTYWAKLAVTTAGHLVSIENSDGGSYYGVDSTKDYTLKLYGKPSVAYAALHVDILCYDVNDNLVGGIYKFAGSQLTTTGWNLATLPISASEWPAGTTQIAVKSSLFGDGSARWVGIDNVTLERHNPAASVPPGVYYLVPRIKAGANPTSIKWQAVASTAPELNPITTPWKFLANSTGWQHLILGPVTLPPARTPTSVPFGFKIKGYATQLISSVVSMDYVVLVPAEKVALWEGSSALSGQFVLDSGLNVLGRYATYPDYCENMPFKGSAIEFAPGTTKFVVIDGGEALTTVDIWSERQERYLVPR